MEQVVQVNRGTGSDRLSLLLDYDYKGLEFLKSHTEVPVDSLNILATSTSFNIRLVPENKPNNIINLKRLNDVRYINKFLETVNSKLEYNGLFIGCFESKEQRKRRIFEKYPAFLAYLFYYFIDFPWKRIIPKISILNKVYFGLTRGHNRVLSVPEVLGRLISCGFQICDYQKINNKTYFCAEKIDTPEYDENPTYGLLISLDRVGFKGKTIQVYKLRTMHPYSEYLQKYIYEEFGTENGDKPKKDFRVTNWGELLRHFWLDELPMLINYFKGELKLVGVRPLSKQKFGTYPEYLQKKRTKFKPGLIPPFYAELPETVEDFFETEKKYLDSYEDSPTMTDVKYFFMALYNILFKGVRSK